jgi:hypothetical protein
MELSRYKFLIDERTQELFAELDFWLKSGQHIQKQHSKQKKHFDFIIENVETLGNYYFDFYQVRLECKEDDSNHKYYYLDFFTKANGSFDRGNINLFKPEYLSPEFVIIGLFLWNLDRFEYTNSIAEVQKMLDNDYEGYKDGFYRLFAKVSTNKKKVSDDKILVDKVIENALRKFGEIAWLSFRPNSDEFEIMPSFHRLTHDLYFDEIQNFNTLFKPATEIEK